MYDDKRYEKAQILIQQQKYKEAEQLLSSVLGEDPNNIYYLGLLAEVNLQLDKPDAAKQLIDSAIGISPDVPLLYYVRSRIALHQNNWEAAEKHINEAIALDPYDADYFALKAHITLGKKQFSEALHLADRALEIDPENLLALNTRSTALNKLDRSEESFETIEGALREDPNNAYTHANYGWALLEQGNHKKALEHFKESLRNNPNFEYAQSGMLEAIKASNPVYRVFLKYSFWMANLTSKYQWGVIIVFFIGIRALRSFARSNETLQPYLTPIIVVLSLVAFSTWIINPISNLFLRFNTYGQLLLDKKEKTSSNLVAASLGIFLISIVLYFALADERFLLPAGFGFAMMLPLSVIFSASKYKYALPIYAIVMAIVGIAAIAIAFTTGTLLNPLATVFVLGFIGFQWVANFLSIEK